MLVWVAVGRQGSGRRVMASGSGFPGGCAGVFVVFFLLSAVCGLSCGFLSPGTALMFRLAGPGGAADKEGLAPPLDLASRAFSRLSPLALSFALQIAVRVLPRPLSGGGGSVPTATRQVLVVCSLCWSSGVRQAGHGIRVGVSWGFMQVCL